MPPVLVPLTASVHVRYSCGARLDVGEMGRAKEPALELRQRPMPDPCQPKAPAGSVGKAADRAFAADPAAACQSAAMSRSENGEIAGRPASQAPSRPSSQAPSRPSSQAAQPHSLQAQSRHSSSRWQQPREAVRPHCARNGGQPHPAPTKAQRAAAALAESTARAALSEDIKAKAEEARKARAAAQHELFERGILKRPRRSTARSTTAAHSPKLSVDAAPPAEPPKPPAKCREYAQHLHETAKLAAALAAAEHEARLAAAKREPTLVGAGEPASLAAAGEES